MSQKLKDVHLFGEMDLNLTLNSDQIWKKAFYIGEQCGYFQDWDKEKKILTITSQDYDIVKIYFENDKVIKVKRSEDEGKNWETLNFNDSMFQVNKKTLLNYKNKIEFHKLKDGLSMPMSQGSLINELMKRYKMPAVAVGWHFDLIGIETKKQFMIWKDIGSHAEFLGLINKDGTNPK